MLSAYLTEEATSMLLLFLSKWWKYNYDQKSITENASVTLSRWTIFIPVSKICPFKQTSSQHKRKNRQKFTLQSSEVCSGSIVTTIKRPILSIFLFLTYIFVFVLSVFLIFFFFFAPFPCQFNRISWSDEINLAKAKLLVCWKDTERGWGALKF